MILEIDAGNSRVKWRLADERKPGKTSIATSFAGTDAKVMLAELGRAVETRSGPAPDRIRVSEVRGEAFRSTLSHFARERWHLEPEYARTTATAFGVTNAYRNPASMGVDRWLALLAAWRMARGACCVLDCGSAITFDWVDASGRHQGGYIVPGLRLMQDSLARKSSALDVPLQDLRPSGPGDSTAKAISGGLLAMVTGFAEHCHATVSKTDQNAQWFLTGGDAALLTGGLSWPHRHEPDLVLDGLAIALP